MDDALRARSPDAFAGAIEVAVRMADDGERALVDVLPEFSGWRQVAVLAALGDASGPLGADALAEVYPKLSSRDGKCAALIALAKRGQGEATPHLVQGLADRDGWVKDYALQALTAVGDASGWDAVFERLAALTRSKRAATFGPSPVVTAVAYLLATGDDNQVGSLLKEIHGWWTRFDTKDRSALARLWPSLNPKGPPRADQPLPPSDRLRHPARKLVMSRATGLIPLN
jgi:HEAT repeat protein